MVKYLYKTKVIHTAFICLDNFLYARLVCV